MTRGNQTRQQRQPQPQRKGTQLYNNNPRGKPITSGTGYKNAKSARKTLKLISTKPTIYQKQVVTTMFYRAKHHKYQTEDMKNAMKIYKDWLETHH